MPESTSLSSTNAEFWKRLNVTFKKTPNSLIIEATVSTNSTCPSLRSIPKDILRNLIHENSLVVFRGFEQEKDLKSLTEQFGEVISWPFGDILEIKDDINSKLPAQARENMPYHYDGMFKRVEGKKELGFVPLVQFFHCIEAYPSESPEETDGCTIFVDTRRILASFTQEELKMVENVVIKYTSNIASVFEKDASVAKDSITHYSPFITNHPVTGERILRYHEPWGPENTKQEATFINIEVMKENGFDIEGNKRYIEHENAEEIYEWFVNKLTPALYSKEYCYAHQWTKNEYVFSDNWLQIHGRNALTKPGRYVRRIHFN